MTKLMQSVEILRLQPDDIIVIETDRNITQHEAEQIRLQARDEFPGHKIIVTTGARLRVNRRKDAAA